MWQYLVKRLFLLVVTLIGICLLSFVLVALAPGDPALTAAGVPLVGVTKGRATDEVLKNTKRQLYLDRPIVVNFTPNTRSRHARSLAKDVCEGSDYVRADAQGSITGGIGTAALDVFIEECVQRSQRAVEVEKQLAAAIDALDGVARNDSATPAALEAAIKAVQVIIPGRGPRLPARLTPLESARVWAAWGKDNLHEPSTGVRALLDALDKLVPPERGGPGAKGEATARATAWAAWWEKNKARYSPERVDAAVAAYMSAPESERAARQADLESLGGVCTGPLMAIYESSSGERRRIAALAVSFLAHNTYDLSPRRDELEKEWETKKIGGDRERWVQAESARIVKDHQKSLARWWFRSEEEYVEFSTPRQMGRAFTQTQFGNWFRSLARLDFGRSYEHKKDVLELIKEKFPRSAWLNFFSIMLTYMIAIPIGVYSATHQKSVADRISTVGLFVLYSLPSFWVGSVVIMLLTGPPIGIKLFPYRGYEDMNAATFDNWHRLTDWLWHITLPVLCLTYGGIAYVSRLMRGSMLEVIRQDYIRTARAKGVAEKLVVFKHAMRNSLIPIITLMATILPHMFGGSVIIESIFSIDGLGHLMFEAITKRDLPLVMAEVFIASVLTLVGILIADIMYAVVDPRIELK